MVYLPKRPLLLFVVAGLSAGCTSSHSAAPAPDPMAAQSAPERKPVAAPVPLPSLAPERAFNATVNGVAWGSPVDAAAQKRFAAMGLHRRDLETGENAWTGGRNGLTVIASHNTVVGLFGSELADGDRPIAKRGEPLDRIAKACGTRLERTSAKSDSSHRRQLFQGYGACRNGTFYLRAMATGGKIDRVMVLEPPENQTAPR